MLSTDPMVLIYYLVGYAAMALYPTPNNSLLRETDTSHELIAPHSTPGRRQSSENLQYHRLLRLHHLHRLTKMRRPSQHRYIFSDSQSQYQRSLRHFLFVPLDGALLDSVPLVLCGPSCVPMYLKGFGKRKSNRRRRGRLKGRSRVLTSINLPSHHGEKQSPVASGVSRRLLAWIVSRVGPRATKTKKSSRNLRNAASWRPRAASLLLS